MIERMSLPIGTPKPWWRVHSAAVIVTVVLALSYAYFGQGAGPNQNSRFDLVRAIVEEHRLSIDSFAANTIDKAQMGDHFYCDKAPGLSLAAVPFYALYRFVAGAPANTTSFVNALYWITWLTVGLATAFTGGLLTTLGPRFGASRVSSATAALVWGLGTPAFAYATLFVAHQWVAFLLVVSFTLLTIPEPKRPSTLFVSAGFAAGFATISEFPIAIAATILGLFAARKHGLRAMLLFGAGGAPPIGLLGFYNARCFGSPFTLGYSRLATPEFQKVISRGFFGIALPTKTALYGVLFSEFRGLLPLSPFLVLAPIGFWLAWKVRERRLELGVIAALSLSLLLLVSSYLRWDGGASMGPRYFLPALPFVTLTIAFCFDRVVSLRSPWHMVSTPLAAILCLASIFLCTAAVSVMPEFPDWFAPLRLGDQPIPRPEAPLRDFVLPWFFMGRLSAKASWPSGGLGLDHYESGHTWDAWNVGERMGLGGLASLLPLVLVWCAGVAALAWAQKQEPPRDRQMDAP